MRPVRFASALEPMEQTMAVVMQSPIFTPMIIAYTELKVKAPVTDSACKIPMVADEL